MSAPSRAAPFHCAFCGDEDLRPVAEPHGAWGCGACLRVFVVKFVGIAPRPNSDPPTEPDPLTEEVPA